MHTLEDFTRAYDGVQHARQGFTPIKECWYSWNYWAQHGQKQFSFGAWMRENKLEYEDVVGTKTFYPNAKVTYDRTCGFNYYNAWRGAQKALDDVEQKFDQIFNELYSALTKTFQRAYSNKELGEAIGMSGEQLRKFAAKRSWYFPHKTKGTK